MDHRCLYGHRVPDSYKYSVQQRLCPTCGAPTITVDGYRLARRLSQEVPLDAITAFNTMYLIEEEHVLVAQVKEAPAETKPEKGEVTLPEDDAAPKGNGTPPPPKIEKLDDSIEMPDAASRSQDPKRELKVRRL